MKCNTVKCLVIHIPICTGGLLPAHMFHSPDYLPQLCALKSLDGWREIKKTFFLDSWCLISLSRRIWNVSQLGQSWKWNCWVVSKPGIHAPMVWAILEDTWKWEHMIIYAREHLLVWIWPKHKMIDIGAHNSQTRRRQQDKLLDYTFHWTAS